MFRLTNTCNQAVQFGDPFAFGPLMDVIVISPSNRLMGKNERYKGSEDFDLVPQVPGASSQLRAYSVRPSSLPLPMSVDADSVHF